MFRWRHRSLGLWTKYPTTGVHDQQLLERSRHLPEGKFAFDLSTTVSDSSNNSLHAVELLGHPDLQIVVNTSLQTVSSTVFRIRVSLQRLSCLITHQSHNNPRTPRDHGFASCSQEMYTRTLALLQSIHVRCVLAMSRVVKWAIYAIVVLDGYIRSVMVFKTQQSTDELRDWVYRSCSSTPTHLLYWNHNRYQHQFQHKLSMGIHSLSCNSTQMASATNWCNWVNS